MRTITTKTNVYSFDELTEKAKEKAIKKLWNVNIDYDWWEPTMDELQLAGIEVIEFDTYRRTIRIKLVSMELALEYFLEEYGSESDYYIESCKLKKYLSEREEMSEEQLENQPTISDITNDYVQILQGIIIDKLVEEYEYLISDEAIIESIEAKQTEFLIDGTPY